MVNVTTILKCAMVAFMLCYTNSAFSLSFSVDSFSFVNTTAKAEQNSDKLSQPSLVNLAELSAGQSNLYYRNIACDFSFCSSFHSAFFNQLNQGVIIPLIDTDSLNKVNNEQVLCIVGALKKCSNALSQKKLNFDPIMIVTEFVQLDNKVIARVAILKNNHVIGVYQAEKLTSFNPIKLKKEGKKIIAQLFQ